MPTLVTIGKLQHPSNCHPLFRSDIISCFLFVAIEVIKLFTPVMTDSEDEVEEVVTPAADILAIKDVWEHSLNQKRSHKRKYNAGNQDMAVSC